MGKNPKRSYLKIFPKCGSQTEIDGLKKISKIMDPTAIGIQCKCSVKYSVWIYAFWRLHNRYNDYTILPWIMIIIIFIKLY